MKYLSIDIETTGLDYGRHQILEFAAVYDDLEKPRPLVELPTFTKRIFWKNLVINDYCLKLHRGLLLDIAEDWEAGNHTDITTIYQLADDFIAWLATMGVTGKYNVAGKNFAGFDGPFLKKVPRFPEWNYRVIDVGSMYLVPNMSELPSLSQIVSNQVDHRALPDALDVVRAIRAKVLPDYPPVQWKFNDEKS